MGEHLSVTLPRLPVATQSPSNYPAGLMSNRAPSPALLAPSRRGAERRQEEDCYERDIFLPYS